MARVRELSASHKGRIIAAFIAIYLIWGSTFLAVAYAIETLPPLMMAGMRFLIAGGLLYAWARHRGAPRPQPVNWPAAIVVGGALILLGTGGTVWAQQRVPSGITAMLITTVPLWIVLLDWLRPSGTRPGGRVIIGLLAGFAGIALLTGPAAMPGGANIDRVGAAVLMLAAFSWAAGSLFARRGRMSRCPILATAMQLLVGGVMLIVAGAAMGEWSRFDVTLVSTSSLFAFVFLTVSTIIAYTAYNWLLQVESPAKISTYAYVNPVVAVLLGWGIASEALDLRTVLALGVILGAVVAINFPRVKRVAIETVDAITPDSVTFELPEGTSDESTSPAPATTG